MEDFLKLEFTSQADLDSYLVEFQKKGHIRLRRRTSHKNKDLETCKIFPHSRERYECIHYGKPRHNIVNSSRPNQNTNALDCKYFFEFKLVEEEEVYKMVVKGGGCLDHNHQISQDSKISKRVSLESCLPNCVCKLCSRI